MRLWLFYVAIIYLIHILAARLLALTLYMCTSIHINFVSVYSLEYYLGWIQICFKPIQMLLRALKFLTGPAGISEHPQTPQPRWSSLHPLFYRFYLFLGSCLIVAYRASDWRKPATHKHFFKKTDLFKEWMRKFVALLMKKKRPGINEKMMNPIFFHFMKYDNWSWVFWKCYVYA